MSGQNPPSPALGQGKGLVSHGVDLVRALFFDRRYFWHTAFLLFLGEAALSLLVIWKIPCKFIRNSFGSILIVLKDTKIDWPAYMQQVDMFLAGERDYSKIEGETGPLVYVCHPFNIYDANQTCNSVIPPCTCTYTLPFTVSYHPSKMFVPPNSSFSCSISPRFWLCARSTISPDVHRMGAVISRRCYLSL